MKINLKNKYIIAFVIICGTFLFTACTITFSNISTDGANSAVDDEQSLSTDISPELEIPAIG